MCSLKCDLNARACYFVTEFLKKPETKLRMLLYLHFTSECHQNVCYFKCEHCAQAGFLGDQATSSSSDYYCTKKCAALSVSNELMLISGKAGGVIGLPQFVDC